MSKNDNLPPGVTVADINDHAEGTGAWGTDAALEAIDLWGCEIPADTSLQQAMPWKRQPEETMTIQTALDDDEFRYTYLGVGESGCYVCTSDLKLAVDLIHEKQEELRRDAE